MREIFDRIGWERPPTDENAMTRGIRRALTVTAVVTLIALTVFESLEHLVAPQISLWQSHAVTIIVGSAVAAIASFFVSRAHAGLHHTLAERHLEAVTVAQEQLAERLRREAALRDSEERFRAIVEQSADIILLLDATGVVTYTSPAVTRVMGYAIDEVLGQSGFRFIHPDDRAAIAERLAIVLERPGVPVDVEFRARRRDGCWRWVAGIATNLLDTPGVGAIISTQRDVTERKQVERSLQERGQHAELGAEVGAALTDTATLPAMLQRCVEAIVTHLGAAFARIWTLNVADNVLELQASAGVYTHLDGVHSRIPVGQLNIGLIAAERQPHLTNDVLDDPRTGDREWARREGMVAFAGYPLIVEQQLVGVVALFARHALTQSAIMALGAVAQEIAVGIERKQAEEALQQESAVSTALARVGRELINALDTPTFLDRLCRVTADVLECDTSHTLLWQPAEDVYAPVAGYGATAEEDEVARVIKVPREMMAGLLAKLEHADVSQVTTIPSDLLSLAEQRRLGLTTNFCLALRRGTTLIGLQVAFARRRTEPFRQTHWRIAQGIAQIASMALEHARVVEELNRASHLKSEFVATMSHELRTPLNVILGYTDLLLSAEFGRLAPAQTEALQRVDRSAQGLLELVNATLDLGRFEAGQAPLVTHEVDLGDLLDEIRAEPQAVAEKPHVTVVWTIGPALPSLHTDSVKLKIVLKNLLNNAVKFTERGTVTVRVIPDAGGVFFSVTDTGIGIAPAALPIIFDAFRQADSSMTRRYGGVGLGLYIVRRFVDLLGGTVAVDSQVGKGSTFRVWIPLNGLHSKVAA